MLDILNVFAPTLKDAYKYGHPFQYPKDTTLVYSNLTARGSRVQGSNELVPFAMQYLTNAYFVKLWNRTFFERSKDEVVQRYRRRTKHYIGDLPSYDHIAALHELGHLPILVKAIPEGSLVPMRVPFFTIRNTKDDFYWVTNMLETTTSNVLWLPCTSATTAYRYRQGFERFAAKTGVPRDFVKWQGHDFSYRGLAGLEAACLSGAAHLTSFLGTDTSPATDFIEQYYFANVEDELISGSVPATEHAVMEMDGSLGELETIRRMLRIYPDGIVSIVCDTWDFWKVLTVYLPQLKEEILARAGKLVIRPDSGDPVKIICGDPRATLDHVKAGAYQVLWNLFGGTVNANGFRELDSHIGLIYGDSITLERQDAILGRLSRAGFATFIVLGIGSYTYQYVTRDTYGLAIKATYGATRAAGGRAIFKDPATDDGVKKSARGLLAVSAGPDGCLTCQEDVSWDIEQTGILRTIFRDGVCYGTERFRDIRARIDARIAAELEAVA